MSDRLAPDSDEFRAMATAAVDHVAAYYESLASRPVLVPSTSQALRARLEEPLPQDGTDFQTLLDTIQDVVVQFSRHSGHPRFFGYVSSPGTPVTAVGSMIASALNLNLTCWRSSPAATEMEHVTINWLKEILGYPATAMGLLTSGGSMANFAALAAARTARLRPTSCGRAWRRWAGACAYTFPPRDTSRCAKLPACWDWGRTMYGR